MTKILRLDSSVNGADSVTASLNGLLVETLTAADPSAEVTTRDLTNLPLVDNKRWVANNTEAEARTPDQAALASVADELIAELEAADTIVFGVPLYNFGVPSSLKAWMDFVARAGRTFSYGEQGPVGHLSGKKAYVVSSSGGVPIGTEMDFATPHLTTFLGFLGISDITQIDAGGLMMDPTKVQAAQEQIRLLNA